MVPYEYFWYRCWKKLDRRNSTALEERIHITHIHSVWGSLAPASSFMNWAENHIATYGAAESMIP